MIKKYLIIFLMMSTLTCSQKKNNDNTNINKTMNKSVNTIIDSFKEKPYYHIKVKSSGVNFDIRINDLPIFRFFGESGGTNIEYPINTGILETGEQILTIKILPIKGKKMIAPENTFTLEINKKSDAWTFDNKREIILIIPKMEVPKEGIPYWEFKTKFNAEVPYQLSGWKNSKKLDQLPNIDKTIKDAYNKIKEAIEQKNNTNFALLTKRKTLEEAISLYEKQEKSLNGFQEEKETILPFTKCIIKFYGDGRLVRLEDEDGESCLKGETKENGKSVIYNYPILFHIPQNSNDLEIIR
ncbi:hypothetical protein B0A78_07015 [Flavobacterium columnare NBRC 100251 = ATCC 23463]|nr:hypothetical protein [Flavobacterium columnare]PDS24371.1 hypothetical protein B0A78_07015 [Flavobacterium columnare NBRC 100251 = ATCC 23463]